MAQGALVGLLSFVVLAVSAYISVYWSFKGVTVKDSVEEAPTWQRLIVGIPAAFSLLFCVLMILLFLTVAGTTKATTTPSSAPVAHTVAGVIRKAADATARTVTKA